MGEEGQLMTVEDVARWLLFTEKTVRQMCDEGEFDGAFKARGEWRIPVDGVNGYIKRQQDQGRRG
jgi:excisionase family DNA binding protein